MDNVTRLKAEAALHAVVTLLNELDRVHGPGFAKSFVEEHREAIDAALATLDQVLELRRNSV